MTLVISEGRAVRTTPSGEARIREAITDVSRRIEDAGWINLSTDPRAQGGADGPDRVATINRSRLYRRRSPLAKQAAKLVQHYVLGQGVTLRPNDKRLVKRIVDEFWEDPVNRRTFTGHAAMTEFIDGLFTDGDQFLVLFPDEEAGTVQLGTIDAAMVQDIVTDPDNWRVPLWYKVARPKGEYNFRKRGGGGYTNKGDEVVWYRDWRNDADDENPAPGGTPPSLQPGLVMHVAINKRGKFGEPELAAAADWLKAHKQFMEDRATINRAAAAIAWRKKRKGGAADVRQAADAIRSSLVGTLQGFEGNPTPAAGSTVVENEGSTMEWVKTDTGGPGVHEDERMLRMMVGSGVGVMNHYFGDEGNANLATATAMALPMQKMYEAWQKLLGDTIEDLVQFGLEVANKAARIGPRDDTNEYSDATTTGGDVIDATDATPREAEDDLPEYDPTDPLKGIDLTAPVDWFVDVDFPPMVQKELKAYVEAMQILATLMPGSTEAGQRLVLGMILNEAGTNNVDQALDRIFTQHRLAAAAAAELAAKSPPPAPPPTLGAGTKLAVLPGGQPAQDPGQAAVAESGARVRRVLASVREASRVIAEADAADAAASGG